MIVSAPAAISSIRVRQPYIMLVATGQQVPLPLAVQLTNGTTVLQNFAPLGVTFASSAPAVATVNADGVVSAAGPGAA